MHSHLTLSARPPVDAKIESWTASREARTNTRSVDARPAEEAVPSAQGWEERLLAYREVLNSRDQLIRSATSAGISEKRVAALMGHSRSTVRAALGKP